ncbi:hypothetical protein GJ698_24285 [Pseudoduganella sp. FT26W]|uniref:HEAT repeat domain-containing protein n=1 Tax=Duganella aquatilis TaxID=2666082 RepID=A0A844DDE1_9BURK|nr:hypothetical protein [Duganella aquatilis]MRW87192.1 hypothetical protein [Duganella aquatilis]
MVVATDSEDVLREYAACSSGYVREAVLRRCAELALPALLPEVAARLDDWVPEVRQAARDTLLRLLPLVPVDELLALAPQVLRQGRGDYASWLAEFEQLLIRRMSVDELCAAAREAEIKVARAIVSVLDTHRLLAPAALIALILARHDDIVLARRAVELCAKLAPAEQGMAYRAAARSHFGAVRTLALKALLAMPDQARTELATAALEDVQSSARQTAVGYLQANGVDVGGYYREVLAQGPHAVLRTRICLTMLASLCDRADLPLIQSFRSSEYPVLRATALALWFKLAEQDKDQIALAAMDDASPRVRKFAVQLVHRHGAYVPFAVILQRLSASDDVLFVLRLAEGNKWHWLEGVARVVLQRGVEEARRLELPAALLTWTKATDWHVNPAPEQHAFLASAPVMNVFSQLLPAQRLAFLRQQLHLD